jgi:peroxiredoxin
MKPGISGRAITTSRRAWTAAAMLVFILGLTTAASGARVPAPGKTIGKRVSNFRLSDAEGRMRRLGDFGDRKAVVLVFLSTGCPVANSYSEVLSETERAYRDRGVQFLGMNSMPDDELETIAQHAREYRLTFPVLRDFDQAVANELGARVTPEVFVLDADRTIRYRGRIDDRYASRTERRNRVDTHDLQLALDAVLAGNRVARTVTEVFGCTIERPRPAARTASVTYHRDVAPILQERCQSCHRPGQVAPFSLMDYRDARKWAREIKLFTQNRQMPPWLPEPGHGEFQDVRRLSDANLATLAAWADAGAPEGNPRQAPEPKQWPDEWMLGTPDLVLRMDEPFAVEATGADVFRCFVLPTDVPEDRYVAAVEIRPGNPRVVHHVLNFVDTSGRARALAEKDPDAGYNSGPGGIGFAPTGSLGGWAPGNLPRFLPDEVGMRLPKGSDVVIQVHYHKTGKPEVDQTSIGLYFAKKPVKRELRVLPLTNLAIDIPPGAERHEVTAEVRLPFAVNALSITPHMHLLGREMKVTATLPEAPGEAGQEDREKHLVWVRRWDYRWQDSYRFSEIQRLPAGTVLKMSAYFDNSANNPLNPHDPPQRVRFGEQTTDEMAFAFIEFTLDQEPPNWLMQLIRAFVSRSQAVMP